MSAAFSSSPHTWLRWLIFALLMGLMAWGVLVLAERRIRLVAETPLKPWEERHLVLTRTTQQDLQPDFSHSVSEPLKKLAPHRTDGLAQPLWPWVAAWMFDDANLSKSLTDLAWFRVGLILSTLMFLGFVSARNFALPAALLIVLLAGFYGLLPTVSEFSGGTLFHLFFLLTWVTCLYGLQRNSLWVYAAAGIFGALAYLSEDRILPLLIVFILVTTLRALWGWGAEHWSCREGTTLWVWSNQTFGLLIMAAMFFSLTGPRLVEADRLFANGLFNYVDHVRWLGDASEGKAWIEAHPDRASLKKMQAVDQLTPASYFQSHSPPEITTRVWQGIRAMGSGVSQQGGRVLLGLAGLLFLLTLLSWCTTPKACHAGERLHPETASTVLFIASVAITYAVIASWDSSVMSVRYLHALTAPLGLSLIWACESVLRRARRRRPVPWLATGYRIILWVLLALVFI